MPRWGINFRLVVSVYGIIFVAELPDKTALASLVLAARHRPLPVFFGAALALTLQSVIAMAAGHVLSFLPAKPVQVVSGLLFLGSAVAMWKRPRAVDEGLETSEGSRGFLGVVTQAFIIVFIAEWGDLTQVGTAALAARYAAPLAVFVGATLALWSVVAVAVFLGSRAARTLSPGLTQRLAAIVFAGVGLALLNGWLIDY